MTDGNLYGYRPFLIKKVRHYTKHNYFEIFCPFFVFYTLYILEGEKDQ